MTVPRLISIRETMLALSYARVLTGRPCSYRTRDRGCVPSVSPETDLSRFTSHSRGIGRPLERAPLWRVLARAAPFSRVLDA